MTKICYHHTTITQLITWPYFLAIIVACLASIRPLFRKQGTPAYVPIAPIRSRSNPADGIFLSNLHNPDRVIIPYRKRDHKIAWYQTNTTLSSGDHIMLNHLESVHLRHGNGVSVDQQVLQAKI